MDNPSLFAYPEGFNVEKHMENVRFLLNMARTSSESSSSSRTSSHLKRTSMYDDSDDVTIVEYHEKEVKEVKRCQYCSRYVKYLIGKTECCTYECILAYYRRDRDEYNYCYAQVYCLYEGNGVIKPAMRKPCDVSVEDYWRRMLTTHYDPTSIRYSELIKEYKSNQYTHHHKNKPNKKQLTN